MGTRLLFEILSRSPWHSRHACYSSCRFSHPVSPSDSWSTFEDGKKKKEMREMIIYARQTIFMCAHEIYWIIHLDFVSGRQMRFCCTLILWCSCVSLFLYFQIDSINIAYSYYQRPEMSNRNIFEASSNYSAMHHNNKRFRQTSSPADNRRRDSHLFR